MGVKNAFRLLGIRRVSAGLLLQEAVTLYNIFTVARGLAAPMTALPNPNPKLEAPSNLALQYPSALRPEFHLAISTDSNTTPIHKRYCVSLHPGPKEIYIILVD